MSAPLFLLPSSMADVALMLAWRRWLLFCLWLGCWPWLLIGWAALESPTVARSDLEQQQRIQALVSPLLGLGETEAAYKLRALAYESIDIELVVRWQAGHRVYPDLSGMSTFPESTLLTEALPGMTELRRRLESGDTGVVSLAVYLSTGQARLYCWQPPVTALAETLCVAAAVPAAVSSAVVSATSSMAAMPDRQLFASQLHGGIAGSQDDERLGRQQASQSWTLLWGKDDLLFLGLVISTLAGMVLWGWRWLTAARTRRVLAVELREQLRELIHDLRLPLANVLLYSGLMSRQPDAARRYCPVLEEEGQRLQSLVSELAALLFPLQPRRWSNRQVSRLAHCPQDQIRRLARATAARLEQSQCQLTLDLGGTTLLSYSPEALNRILHNLLDNCARHAPGSRVTLVCREEGSGTAAATLVIELCCRYPAGTRRRSGWWRWHEWAGTGLGSCRRLVREQGWCWRSQLTAEGYRAVLQMPLSDAVPVFESGVLRV
jgi:signal transduction histidine kinase